jgi:hypothetical protein
VGKHLFAEISCDYCGNAEHFSIDKFTKGQKRKYTIKEIARQKGWIITRDGKFFDTKECYKKYTGGKNDRI